MIEMFTTSSVIPKATLKFLPLIEHFRNRVLTEGSQLIGLITTVASYMLLELKYHENQIFSEPLLCLSLIYLLGYQVLSIRSLI